MTIKALLLIAALGGEGEYKIEMSTMDSCMKARDTISKQESNVKTLCIPLETGAYIDGWFLEWDKNGWYEFRNSADRETNKCGLRS